jgi:hypothetical protein
MWRDLLQAKDPRRSWVQALPDLCKMRCPDGVTHKWARLFSVHLGNMNVDILHVTLCACNLDSDDVDLND